MSNPDPIVSIITDGRFAAIDPRFFGAKLEGESIITKMASNVVAKYHATKGNVYHDKEGNPAPIKGSTQIVSTISGSASSRREAADSILVPHSPSC